MDRQPAQSQAPVRPRTNVLLVGKRWDLVAPTLSALADRGNVAFEGPVEATDAAPEAQLFLMAPDAGRIAEYPRRDRGDGSMVPLLLCVPWHALEAEDIYVEADDFIAVPCSVQELGKRIARLAAQRPRLAGLPVEKGPTPSGVQLNTETYEVTVGGAVVNLTWMEFQLLRFFVQNPGRVFRREEILQHVWGADYIGGVRTVDVHIRRLRSKLGTEGERWLRTVRNVGYGWERE